ncbi:methyl-accepting chemotaxis protein [Chromobacterium haemolyticum]|uniref:Methyl-accepting chemotaxis protein n=1 Tax=Chromobacterium fluminis TaxID=3044269 RepID=A0ABX0LB25_9NEIS|nr:methyl-accepting chemotaxis protein [Chromobacterium haemolyticum]NHR06816.1 methyl-accepting chemotaxis protein [Chromobacterium haemolyticum]
MLHQLTVKQKLLAGFGLLIILIAIIVAVAMMKLNTISDKIRDVTEDRYPKIVLANKISVTTLDIGRSIRNAIIVQTPEETEIHLKRVEELRAANASNMDQMEKLLSTPKGKELFDKLKSASANLGAQFEPLYALARANKNEEAKTFLMKTFAPANNAFLKSLKEMSDFQEDLMQKSIEASKTAQSEAVTVLLTVAVIALFAAMAIAIFIANLVTVPLKKSAQLVRNIKQGDLSGNDERIPDARDEAIAMAKDIQEMRQGLREVVASIQKNANEVSDSAHELASMSEQVAHGAQRQSEATSEAAATIEELTVSINHVADNSNEASRQAAMAGDLASRGGHAVKASVGNIESVSSSVAATSDQMKGLTQEVQKIGNIVTVIRDVADQTNLLALNAAIEAARAGEMGRGFAVVADEVRKLAERTASSAQEITQMIGSIQGSANRVVGSMEQSLSSVGTVSDGASQATDSMQEIEGSTHSIVHSIGNITSALSEQRTASLNLAQSMERVSQMAEENSATVEELATTSSQLNALAQNLQGVTSRFRL